jgi:L-asparaginase
LANLRGALAAAAEPALQGAGTLVVLDGSILPAREATKASSFELHAFEAPGQGPLGRIEASGQVVLRRSVCPPRSQRRRFDLSRVQALPRVDIVVSYAGADGTAIDAAVEAGAKGLVSMGLAPGRPANGEQQALVRAVRRGVCVVQSARCARPTVVPQRFLERDGILAGGDLAPQKLRILLMLLLNEEVGLGARQAALLSC